MRRVPRVGLNHPCSVATSCETPRKILKKVLDSINQMVYNVSTINSALQRNSRRVVAVTGRKLTE